MIMSNLTNDVITFLKDNPYFNKERIAKFCDTRSISYYKFRSLLFSLASLYVNFINSSINIGFTIGDVKEKEKPFLDATDLIKSLIKKDNTISMSDVNAYIKKHNLNSEDVDRDVYRLAHLYAYSISEGFDKYYG